MIKKKYQVFVSSTYEDLKEERQKAVEAILSSGNIPAGMELFQAGDETQKELIEEWIIESDVYLLILGGRYGSVDSTGKSYTQWEYEKAIEHEKPCFSLVLTEDYINKKAGDGLIMPSALEMTKPEYKEFKENVKSRVVAFINNIDQIESNIYKSLQRVTSKYGDNLIGWVKGSVVDDYEKLKGENKDLSSKLVDRQEQVLNYKEEPGLYIDNYIGEFNYETLKNVLTSTIIDEETGETVLHFFTKHRDEFIEGLSIFEDEIKDNVPVCKLLRYDLIEEQGSNINFDKYFTLTSIGKKFLNMFEAESISM